MERDSGGSEFEGLLRLVRRKGAIIHLRDNSRFVLKKSLSAAPEPFDMAIFTTGARSMMGRMRTRLMTALTVCEGDDGNAWRDGRNGQDLGLIAWLLRSLIRALQSIYDYLFMWEGCAASESQACSSPSSSLPPDASAEAMRVSQACDRDALSDLIIDSMLVYSPSEEKREQLMSEIRVLGPRALAIMSNFGVKMVIIGEENVYSQVMIGNMPLSWKGRKAYGKYDMDSCRGLYAGDHRLLLVRESAIGQGGFESVAIHECAHAIDHAIKEDRRLISSLSVRLWNHFSRSRKALVSSYAGENPVEYFAESVSAYFSPVKRSVLHECDPGMFSFLNDLFAA